MKIKIGTKTRVHLQREIIYISGRPSFSQLLKIMEHEYLHIIVNKIAGKRASNQLDNLGIAYLIAYKPNKIGQPLKNTAQRLYRGVLYSSARKKK